MPDADITPVECVHALEALRKLGAISGWWWGSPDRHRMFWMVRLVCGGKAHLGLGESLWLAFQSAVSRVLSMGSE
jgi:hypothetical protein